MPASCTLWTPQERQKLAELLQSQTPWKQIVALMHRSYGSLSGMRATLYAQTRDPRYQPSHRNPKVELAQQAVIRAYGRLRGHGTLADLVRASGVGYHLVQKTLKRFNLELTLRERAPCQHHIARIVALATMNHSDAEIAGLLHISKRTVVQITSRLRGHGVPIPYNRPIHTRQSA